MIYLDKLMEVTTAIRDSYQDLYDMPSKLESEAEVLQMEVIAELSVRLVNEINRLRK